MKIIGTIRALDDTRGAVRMEDVYDTAIDDVWKACTTPERLARWIAEVSGDPRVGGTVHAVFTSTWAGPVRIEVCDAPHHPLLTGEPGTDDETQIEAWLTAEGSRTRLVVEERGLPVGQLHFHGAGWQVHLEDLGRSLVNGARHTPAAGRNRRPPRPGRSAGPSSPRHTSTWRTTDVRAHQAGRGNPERARRTRSGAVLCRDHRRRRARKRALGRDHRPGRVRRVPAGRRLPAADLAGQHRAHADASRLPRRRPRGDRARALAAGATRLDVQPNSAHCLVYADPAGHPFCLSTWEGQHLASDRASP